MFMINNHWGTGKEQDVLNKSLFGSVNLISYKKDDHSITKNGCNRNEKNKLKRKVKLKEKECKKKMKYNVNENNRNLVEKNIKTMNENGLVTTNECVHIKMVGRHDNDKEVVKRLKKTKKDKSIDEKLTVEADGLFNNDDIRTSSTCCPNINSINSACEQTGDCKQKRKRKRKGKEINEMNKMGIISNCGDDTTSSETCSSGDQGARPVVKILQNDKKCAKLKCDKKGMKKGKQIDVENNKERVDVNVDDTLCNSECFNELYSHYDSVLGEIPHDDKKRKKKKEKRGQVDVMVISESNELSDVHSNKKCQEKHCVADPDNNVGLQKTKLSRKKEKRKKQDGVKEKSGKPLTQINTGDKISSNNDVEVAKSKVKKKKKKRKKSTVEPLDVAPKCNIHENKNILTLNNGKVEGNIYNSTDNVSNLTCAVIDNNNSPFVPPPSKKFKQQHTSKYNKFQQKIVQKLKGGQFRWINEKLYSCKSCDAVNMFVSDPKLFDVYHNGFHAQVQQWPQNPVDVIIQYIKARDVQLVVGDFGCGDAKVASNVPNKVHSFDLVAVNERVTACDMKNVPLPPDSIDIAVFCLSLMGTNLVDFLTEAHRVMKIGGILKIAEVKSRFDDVDKFSQDVCSIGFNLLEKDDSNKMFVMLEFEKRKDVPSKTVCDITLNPCIYKRR